jgi:hypothetical protein
MRAKSIIEGLLLVVIITSAGMLLPDLVRCMKNPLDVRKSPETYHSRAGLNCGL